MKNIYSLINHTLKGILLLAAFLLTPTAGWSKTFNTTYRFVPYSGDNGYFECYDDAGRWSYSADAQANVPDEYGICVQGGKSLRITSEDVFPAVLSKVIVTAGVGGYITEGTESVTLTVEGEEQDVYVTNINRYTGSASNVEFREYTFSPSRNSEGTIDIQLSVGTNCDLYIQEVIVQYRVITNYDLTVGNIQVDDENASNITGSYNQAGQPQVSYNDNTKTLTLNGLNVEANEDQNYITSSIADMKVRLVGSNYITLKSSKFIPCAFTTDKKANKITFTTQNKNPGSLVVSGVEDTPFDMYDKGNILYRNNLLYKLEGNVATIKEFLDPIIEAIGEKTVDGDGDGIGKDIKDITDANIPANGIVVNKILYTLGKDDGYDPEDTKDGMLVDLNTQVTSIPEAQPGTVEYAKDFHGMTFLLPAGKGTVTVEARTNESGILNVKIGDQEPKVYQNLKELTELEIPYACTHATLVYIYNSAPMAAVADFDSHRAPGRRLTGTTQLKKVKINVRAAASTSPVVATPKTLTKDDIKIVDGHITVTDGNITDLAEDVFEGITELTYVDLSATAIFGLTVDRKALPFNNLPESAFVYLPYDNDVEEGNTNVVIGDICPEMVLGTKAFDAAMDFTAATVTMEGTLPRETTIMLPFSLDEDAAGKIGTFYAFDGIEGSQVKMKHAPAVDANKPYMLKAFVKNLTAEMVDVDAGMMASAPEHRASSTPEFIGVYKATSLTSDAYVYEDGAFKLVTTTTMVDPFHAYIKAEGATASPLSILYGTLGIQNIQTSLGKSDVYYDLRGRRLYGKPVSKGVYIHQGRKVIVK